MSGAIPIRIKKRAILISPACDEILKRTSLDFLRRKMPAGLGCEPILLIPGKMFEFGLIHLEMRQDLLADGSPLQ